MTRSLATARRSLADGATVRLDVDDVAFIDPTGINVLVLMDRRSTQRGCGLMLTARHRTFAGYWTTPAPTPS